jgi:hypothetical protein
MSLTLPYNLTNGTTADASQVMADFNAIVNYVNALVIPTTPLPISLGGTGATNAPGALTNLGLANQLIISGTATQGTGGSANIITFTPSTSGPTVSAYALGLTICFQCPGTVTGAPNIRIQIGTLGAVILYNTPIYIPTTSLAPNQIVFATYSPALNGWTLLNSNPASGYLIASNNLSDVTSTAQSLTNLGAAAIADFTTGQVFGGLGGNGNQPMTGGLIFKWGMAVLPASGGSVSNVAVTFPQTYAGSCFGAVASATRAANSGTGYFPSATVQNLAPTGFTLTGDTLTGGAQPFNQTVNAYWIAWGH